MRLRFFIISLILIGIVSVGYLYIDKQCDTPITYNVGQIDARFNLTHEDISSELEAVVTEWENKTGQDLFVQSDNPTLVVDFKFDERQLEADGQTKDRKELDAIKEESTILESSFADLEKSYDKEIKTYESKRASYESALQEHNDSVQKYNDAGGASSEILAELAAAESKFRSDSDSIEADGQALASLGTKINSLHDQHSSLIDKHNQKVQLYNERYGFDREFTQGDYHDNVINIYKFSDRAELRAVLLHEFGHSLGLDHVDDKEAIMYYLMEDTSFLEGLSASDVKAFRSVCNNGAGWSERVARWIGLLSL